jgi:large subunit ribosomal protein L10e
MAKIRKFVAYRHLERPYTRFSKFQKYNYVRARPVCKVVNFTIGDATQTFETEMHLIPTKALQIRDNAIESARQSCNRVLERDVGKGNYYMQTKMYPHHGLRENPLASGAGADSMSTGMAHSFGKPIGVAAQMNAGKKMFTVRVNKLHIDIAKKALHRAGQKLPCTCKVVIEQAAKKPAAVLKPVAV